MSFAAPLGLLALLAVPVIVALHMFRRRYPPRTVAGLFLFAPDARVAASGRRRARLIRSASLWLEIAVATLLSLWLAGPRFLDFGAPPHLVVVLDDSASMGAVGHDGASVASRARARVRRQLDDLGSDALVTLIATGPRPRLLVGPAARALLAGAALDAWQPLRPRHDHAPALDLGRELGDEGASLLFVTDAVPEEAPRGFSVLAVGEARDNAALVHARRVPLGEGERLFIDATAYAAAPLPRTLRVVTAGDGQVVGARSADLVPDRLARFELDLPPGTGPVEVRLDADALAIDDTFVLLPEPRPKVAVAVNMSADVAAALELEAALRALRDRIELGSGEAADLSIGEVARAGGAAVQLVVVPGAEPVEAFLGPFLFERRHPVLRGLTFDGVIWSAGATAPEGRPLVFVGERALLTEAVLGERTRFVLDLAPGRSNFATSPDWPILLSNLVDFARGRLPGPLRVNLRSGELIEWRRAVGEDTRAPLELTDPDGGKYVGRGLRLVTFAPWRVGVHTLARGDVEIGRYAVNFVDGHESDLRRAGSAEVIATAAPRGETAKAPYGHVEQRTLAFLLLILVLVDWFVLAPAQRAAEVA